MWFKQVGNAFANAVAVDGGGNVLVTGYHSGPVKFGGGSLSSINGGTDVFVAKYSSSGGYVWARSYGGSSIDMPKAIAVDGSGNAVVIGYFQGTANYGGGSWTSVGGNDIFIAKYASADGSPIWAKTFGSTTYDYGYGVAV